MNIGTVYHSLNGNPGYSWKSTTIAQPILFLYDIKTIEKWN